MYFLRVSSVQVSFRVKLHSQVERPERASNLSGSRHRRTLIEIRVARTEETRGDESLFLCRGELACIHKKKYWKSRK